jgi:NADH-quinone oxidoreductase subunit N
MQSTAQLPALLPALPELILSGGALFLLMVGAYRGERSTPVVAFGAIALLIAGIVAILWLPGGKTMTFGGSFILDDFARFLKVLAFGGSAAAILMSQNYLARENQNRFEYPVLVLLSTTGMGMMISAGDLIALYLGLELMSLSLYVLAAGNRDSVRSNEAGLNISSSAVCHPACCCMAAR